MKRPFEFLALFCILCLPVKATSQQREPADTARRDSSVATLPAVHVRATIAPTAGSTIKSGIPARISSVTGSEIETWKPHTVAEALASQPGISTYDDLGASQKLNVVTRGFNAGPTVGLPPGVTVFLDGVRQNEPDAQEVNFDLLPLDDLERIELLSGSASLLGPNSLGGAINLVTRRGGDGASGDVEVEAASFGGYSTRVSGNGRSKAGFDYYAGGGYDREKGWREATHSENYNGVVNVGHSAGARGLNLQLYGAHARAETAGSLPETIFDIAPRTNFTAGDFENLDAEQAALSAYSPVGPARGFGIIYFRRSQAERFNVNQAPDASVRSFTMNYTAGSTADLRKNFSLGRGSLALRAGLDGSANRVRVRIYSVPDAIGDSLTTDVRSPSWNVAAYTLADYQLGRVALSAGARYDVVRVPFQSALAHEQDTTSTFRSFDPRAGISVDVGHGSSVYASVGKSFRAPAILELACADPDAACPLPFALGDDPPLNPVRATTYEIGARWPYRLVTATASVYRTEVRDEIFFVASDNALLSGYFTNLPKTRREGIEISAQIELPGVSAYANYAWNRASFRSAADIFSIRSDDDFAASGYAGANSVMAGDRLPLVPDQQIKMGASIEMPANFEVGLSARYTGKQWLRGDEANETAPLKSFVVSSAQVSWNSGGWKIGTVVTNLFNSRAAVFGTFNENRQTGELERFLTPLTARTLRVSLQRSLGSECRGCR